MADKDNIETSEETTENPPADTTTSETTEVQPTIIAEPVIEDDAKLLGKKNISENYSPMESDRVERKYASEPNGKVVDRVAPEDTPKTPPPTAENKTPFDGTTGDSKGKPTPESPKTDIQNTQMAALSPEEQKQASEMLVDGLLGLYRQLNDLGAWATKVSDDQITEWILDEKLSEDTVVPYGSENKRVTVKEFYKEFNDSVAEAAHIPPDHFDSVRASMIREFVRRGWGITDMQNIIQFFVRDFTMRAANFYVLKRQNTINTKLMFKLWEQQKEILKNQNKQEDKGDSSTADETSK